MSWSGASLYSDDAVLGSGGTISHTEHNTHRTNVRDLLSTVLAEGLATERHHAGASEPDDTSNGVIWFDSANGVYKSRIGGAWVDVVGRTLTQTLTNKTLTSPTLASSTVVSGTVTFTGTAYQALLVAPKGPAYTRVADAGVVQSWDSYGIAGLWLSYNLAHEGSGVTKYLNSEAGAYLRVGRGDLEFFTAPTGTGGAAVTPTSRLYIDATTFAYNGNNVWHSGNDGPGSGLDADLLDGQQGAYYLALANHTGRLPGLSNLPTIAQGQILARFSSGTGDVEVQAAPVDLHVLARKDSAGGLNWHPVDAGLIAVGGVDEARLASSAVSQGKLKSTTDSQTQASIGASGTYAEFTWTGSSYTLGWAISHSRTDSGVSLQAVRNQAGGVTMSALRNDSGGSITAWFLARYIQASPPYDLGDGEIPGVFVFCTVDSLGRVHGIACAMDPMWANNGPTPINLGNPNERVFESEPVRGGDGTILTPAKRYVWMPKCASGVLDLDECGAATNLDYANSDLWEAVEMTQAVKNRDMPLFPHPFIHNDLTGLTVVLLDPFDPITERLTWHHEHRPTMRVTDPASGQKVERVVDGCALIELGYVTLDNEVLSRKGPPGVQIVRPRWRN